MVRVHDGNVRRLILSEPQLQYYYFCKEKTGEWERKGIKLVNRGIYVPVGWSFSAERREDGPATAVT